ncbi:MAG: 5-(carboxyamino)imidazole ribonucleotide synthase [Candidatus Nitrosocaldaceae archaeon]
MSYTITSKFRLSLDKPLRLGIIGGGQLGKMIAQEAYRMGLSVVILDPTKDCPASKLADEHIVADFDNEDAIIELAKRSDILTYEIELANAFILSRLEREGYRVAPSSYTLNIIQDKLIQRKILKENNIPVPRFEEVNSRDTLLAALDKLGYPAILKARRGSYDGRGNFVIRDKNDIDTALYFIANKPSFLEEFVNYSKEVSIMVARNVSNSIATFPLVENIHRDSILYLTLAPAKVDEKIKEEAENIANKCMNILKGAGIFGIEMFVNDRILVNEIAPRPHNSGHYSIEACDISQFEMHIRAILDLPLHNPKLLTAAAMVNILGDLSHVKYVIEGIDHALTLPNVRIHIYGKKESKKGRKLGHITALADSVEEAASKAERARSMIRIVGA